MYEELFGQGKNRMKDIEYERNALNSFKQKREAEMNRRLRAIEFEKQRIIKEIEKDIADKIKDYEELLRRKREEERLIDAQRKRIREMIERQKRMMKERMKQLGDKDRENILTQFEIEYDHMNTAIQRERKRQYIMMQDKLEKRRRAREKMFGDRFGEKDIDMGILKNGLMFMDENSRMNRMLNQWKEKTQENVMLQKNMAETAKLELQMLKKPGVLVNELLKRVKSLENLLKNFQDSHVDDLRDIVGNRHHQLMNAKRAIE